MEGKHLLYIDGASRGNPGKAGTGYVIRDREGGLVDKGGRFLGRKTNNFAEYSALIDGLQSCISMKLTELDVRSDSELLVRQLNGQYRVKSPNLAPLVREAKKLLERFDSVTITHIGREQNREADSLANLSIDRSESEPEKDRQSLED